MRKKPYIYIYKNLPSLAHMAQISRTHIKLQLLIMTLKRIIHLLKKYSKSLFNTHKQIKRKKYILTSVPVRKSEVIHVVQTFSLKACLSSITIFFYF